MSQALASSLLTALVSGVFALTILRRWWQRRRAHQLAWGIGMAMYFTGALSQVILTQAWSPTFFALWYWCGALMTAPWLGQGTIYLLLRRGNIARNIQMALLLVAVMTLPWALWFTPLDGSAWRPQADMTALFRDIMPAGSGTVRFFSPVMNTWGTVALVGGALWSARLFRRKQIMRARVYGNWLIAAGGLLPALGGTLIRLGEPSLKYMAEMAGAILIFAGFLLATRPAPQEP
ncbi:MAG: hypothetical protein OXB89_03430 [Anaerolineaceae bacterium]|nr:hypothetical protein [Anaerolineaceae bacterium]